MKKTWIFFRKIHKTSFLQKSPNFPEFRQISTFSLISPILSFFKKPRKVFKILYTINKQFLKTITWAFLRLTNTSLFLKLKAALFYSARSTLQTIERVFQKWKTQLFVCKTTWVWDRTLPAVFPKVFSKKTPRFNLCTRTVSISVLKTQRLDWNRQLTPKIDRRVLTNHAQKHFVRLAHLKRILMRCLRHAKMFWQIHTSGSWARCAWFV